MGIPSPVQQHGSAVKSSDRWVLRSIPGSGVETFDGTYELGVSVFMRPLSKSFGRYVLHIADHRSRVVLKFCP